MKKEKESVTNTKDKVLLLFKKNFWHDLCEIHCTILQITAQYIFNRFETFLLKKSSTKLISLNKKIHDYYQQYFFAVTFYSLFLQKSGH